MTDIIVAFPNPRIAPQNDLPLLISSLIFIRLH